MGIFDKITSAFRTTNSYLEVGEPNYQFVGFAKEEHSLASPPSRGSDPESAEELDLSGGYTVKIMKGLRQITLFRFLTAKALYEEDGLHLDEFLVLFELYYSFLEFTDKTFVEKYGNWFEKSIPFYQDLAKAQSFPMKLDRSNEDAFGKLIQFLAPVLPSKSAYFGLKGQKLLRRGWKLNLNRHLPPAKVQPKAFIGVGYRDKGSRKDVAYDGSPSWQEVSSHFSELERRAWEEELNLDSSQVPLLLE